MFLAFVDKLASQNNGVKCLLVAVDIFSRFFRVQTMKTKYVKDTLQAFRKTISRKNTQEKLWVDKRYTELEKILKNLEATETDFFAKSYEKYKILSDFLETKNIIFDDYACLKVQFLIFKDDEYDWRCSNYPFRHAKTLHCAVRKAFAYGTWTRCFFNKL